MSRVHGITATSYDHIVFGPGKVTKDLGEAGEAEFGATAGGCEFNLSRTIREIDLDGARGPVKGGKRVERVEARIKLRLKELQGVTIQNLIAGGNLAADSPVGWDSVTGGEIASGDYLTNLAISAEHSSLGNNIILIIDNPLPDGDLNFGLDDEGEPVLEGDLLAHFDPSTMSTEPWAIRFPNV